MRTEYPHNADNDRRRRSHSHSARPSEKHVGSLGHEGVPSTEDNFAQDVSANGFTHASPSVSTASRGHHADTSARTLGRKSTRRKKRKPTTTTVRVGEKSKGRRRTQSRQRQRLGKERKDRMYSEKMHQFLNTQGAANPEMDVWVRNNHMAHLFHLANQSRTKQRIKKKREQRQHDKTQNHPVSNVEQHGNNKRGTSEEKDTLDQSKDDDDDQRLGGNTEVNSDKHDSADRDNYTEDEIPSQQNILFQAFLAAEDEERRIFQEHRASARDTILSERRRSEAKNGGVPVALRTHGRTRRVGGERSKTADAERAARLHELYDIQLSFQERSIYGPMRPEFAQSTPRGDGRVAHGGSQHTPPRTLSDEESEEAHGWNQRATVSPRDPFGLEARRVEESAVDKRRKTVTAQRQQNVSQRLRIKLKPAVDTGLRRERGVGSQGKLQRRPGTAPAVTQRPPKHGAETQRHRQRASSGHPDRERGMVLPSRPKTASEKMRERKQRQQERQQQRDAKKKLRPGHGAQSSTHTNEKSAIMKATSRSKARAEAAKAAKLNRICLYAAIDDGDVAAVRRLIAQKVDLSMPNECHARLLPPLHQALAARHSNILRELLVAGADPSSRDKDGATALLFAIDEGLPGAAVEIILGLSGSRHRPALYQLMGAVNSKGQSALHAAAARGYVDVVTELLDRGVEPNELNAVGYSALSLACMHRAAATRKPSSGKTSRGTSSTRGSHEPKTTRTDSGVDVAATVRVLSQAGGRVVLPDGARSTPEALLAQYNPRICL